VSRAVLSPAFEPLETALRSSLSSFSVTETVVPMSKSSSTVGILSTTSLLPSTLNLTFITGFRPEAL